MGNNIVIEEDFNITVIETDFERLHLKVFNDNSEKIMYESDYLLRFINDDYFDDDEDIYVHGICFLPTHIEAEIEKSFLENIELKKYLRPYCNEFILNELGYDEDIGNDLTYSLVNKKEYEHKHRHKISTSFFRVYKDTNELLPREELKRVVLELKENIRSIEDFKVCVGFIEEGIGVLEVSKQTRTKDPESRHVSFWKYSKELCDKTFNDLSKNFKIV